jgi:hypothetical protein
MIRLCRLSLVLVVCALVGCGSDAAPPRPAPARAGQAWCENLRARGLLLEPMSRCLNEYDEMADPAP